MRDVTVADMSGRYSMPDYAGRMSGAKAMNEMALSRGPMVMGQPIIASAAEALNMKKTPELHPRT